MTRIAISQPMLFPWVGLLEQMRLADVWVHYDDVHLSWSGFTRRVQVKTERGMAWLTVPVRGSHQGQFINQAVVENPQSWVPSHMALLERAHAGAPHAMAMLTLVQDVYRVHFETLAELTIASMEALRTYFALARRTRFVRSSDLGIPGAGSDRILAIVQALGGEAYVTGHGAKNYLDHAKFESAGVRVEYMDYQMAPYPQLHGAFTPFVSALDLVANAGTNGASALDSPTVDWRTFLARDKAGAPS